MVAVLDLSEAVPRESTSQRKRYWRWSPITLLLLVLSVSAWGDVTARLDRDSTYLGDRVMLTIEADVTGQVIEPDLSSLEADFTLLGTSTGRQTQILNGQRSDTIRWSIQLQPKRTGTLTIPAINVAQQQTSPLTVTVAEPQAQVNDSSSSPLFLEVEARIGDQVPYVQQQIRYSTRLYLQQPLISGNLSTPQVSNAVVEQLGEQSVYRTTRNGKEIQVIERNYAIFPEASGELRIPPLQFTGRIASPRQVRKQRSQNQSLLDRFFGQDPFGAFNRDDFFAGTPFGDPGVPVSRQSKELIIPVRPRPAGYSGKYWLPAEKLQLIDSWGEEIPVLRVGEPVTRTISIEAQGLESSQLPALEFGAPPAVRIYPEQPTTTNSIDQGWVVSRSEQALAYIPESAGEITFPEVRLEWWDTKSDSQRSAVIPARTITVEGSAGDPAMAPLESPPAAVSGAGESSSTPDINPDSSPVDPGKVGNIWKIGAWLGAAGVGMLLLLLGWLFVGRRRRGYDAQRQGEEREHKESRHKIARRLDRACADNNAAASAKALLELASLNWPEDPPRSLGALADRVGEGAELLHELEQVLYAENPSPWQGDKLGQMFKRGFGSGKKKTGAKQEPVAPLYPPV